MNKRFLIILCCLSLLTFSQIIAAPPQNGRYKEFYAAGQLKISGHYKSGIKNKTWLYYEEGGKLLSKEKWKNGELEWKVKYENGKVSEIIDKEGNVKVYSKCGC